MSSDKVNLFVYGSLRDRAVFRSVCGVSFTFKPSQAKGGVVFAELALLPGYKKVSPDNVYFYAVADKAAKIEGLIIYDVPVSAVEEIDKYEGKRYKRETVKVNTANGYVDAELWLASEESMEKHFGDRWHVNLIQELWLRKRIEKFIAEHTRPGEKSVDARLERLAQRELLATTERDLVISHYDSSTISDFYIEHELDRPRKSIKHLYSDGEARPFIENYLALLVKQVLLNQLDEKIHTHYRYELENILVSERYYKI